MSALTLTLKQRPARPLDLAPITPDKLQGRPVEEIKDLRLACGKEQLPVEQFFDVSGDDPDQVVIRRSHTHLVGIGRGMQSGSIDVQGDAGDGLGHTMSGGTLRVRGNAGHGTGCGMRGGLIEIGGNAGAFLGAGEAGNQEGMSEGVILIAGNCGDRIGDQMRRGMIVVQGDAGDYPGSRMKGGTIVVLGRCGRYPGLNMRRGTLVLAKSPKQVSASFNSSGVVKMEFLRVLFRELAGRHRSLAFLRGCGPEAERWMGDLANGGRGELLVMQNYR